jgi:hypothetical protein
VRRAWAAPLWAHAAALAVVLLALLSLVDPSTSYSADEGAAIIQARSLADGGGWIVEHPFPEADPTGERYPLELSEWGTDGVAPYAKHPLYPVLLAGADRLGGTTAMILLSLVGTVAAAVVAASLSARVRPGIERSTLWTVGLVSPLLFSAFWVIAHSLAAALAGLAVLAALRAAERDRIRWSVLAAVAATLSIGLRTEAVFLAGGLLAIGAWEVVRHRSRAWFATGALVAVGALAVRLGEPRLVRQIVGSPRSRPMFGDASDSGFVADRWDGFAQTWLRPAVGPEGTAVLLGALAVLFAAIAVWQLRRRRPDLPMLRVAAIAAAALIVARVVSQPTTAVPGLIAAFPLLWIGLVAGGRDALPTPSARRMAAIAGIGSLGVLATQYPEGGSAEWGGRYFAVFLPLAVPLALAGLVAVGERLDRDTLRIVGGSLLVGSLALSGLAVAELRVVHGRGERSLELIGDAAASLPSPVIVSTAPALPRFAWETFEDQRWLLVDPMEDDTVVRDLERAGVEEIVVVSYELEDTLERLGGLERIPGRPGSRSVAVVRIP